MTWKALILIIFGSFLLAACSTAATPTAETSTAPPPATTDNFAPTSPPADTPPSSNGAGSADLVAQGREIFIGKGTCLFCHTIEGISTGLIGPDLTHIGTDAAERKPGVSAKDYLIESIREPEAFVAEGVERAVPRLMTAAITASFNDEEVAALVEFLLTQK